MKLYVNMPAGELFGWAICGKNLITEMCKLSDNIRYVPDEIYNKAPKYDSFQKYINNITEKPNGDAFNTLHAIDNETPIKWKGKKNVGYMFYEEEIIPEFLVGHLKAYDVIVTGSTWNTEVVKKHGFDNVVTIHQGVNCDIFKPIEKKYFNDKFVIFSGGKLEHRKGQDIVARAVGEMQRKYPDVFLIASWGNVFLDPKDLDNTWSSIKNDLMPDQTMLVDMADQKEMAKYMNESDIGVFPNRSEGGTNLVMMEYMACGKPVIANNATGQKDVLNSEYALLIEGKTDEEIMKQCKGALEFAYHNRGEHKAMGEKAREAMKSFTWEKTAKEFLKLYEVNI